jgi:N-acetylneuraminic acid mutarotase
MVFPWVSRSTFAMVATVGAVSCSTSPPDTSITGAATTKGMFLHQQQREANPAKPTPFSAPPGAHLQYFGGRIVSNIQVVQVIYGSGSYIPEVLSTSTPSMATFYQGVLNSPYVDWLSEYNTVGLSPPTSSQVLGRGSFLSQATITPAAVNNGTVIDDDQIQAELASQIAAGNVPAPTHDAAGNNNTYYAIFFPHGKTITLGGSASCQVFCAYHGTIANAGGHGEIEYGVHPDFQPGSGCEFGCGAAATQFGNYTQVASHELVETMTDPEVGLAQVFGPPLAWADLVFSEIGDICNDQNGHVVGADGVTYDVQTEFSNSLNDCIVTNPLATPLVVGTPAEACRGTSSSSTITLLGGAGRFTSPVTLSLTTATPTPPPGGEITATFDPNPVPTPSVAGSTATMHVSTTALTPPGTYTLRVQAASTGLTTSTTTTFVVRSQVPGGPNLVSPVNNADGASSTGPFTWSAVDQATLYTLEIFNGSDCQDKAFESFTTSSTNFTIPDAQALAAFQSFSWHVSAANSCGGTAPTSACFNFRTASCSDPHDLITNGGFESGFSGWTIDAAVPPPTVDGTRPHSGTKALGLGTFVGTSEPLGDTQVSQTLSIPGGGSPKLTFWEWPLTTDSVTFDQQYVRVTPISPAGATVVLMNEARNDQTYVLRQFDMSAFAGMTVKLTFGVHQDGFGDITGMFVDDVAVVSQNCGPPDFAVHVTPPAPAEACAGATLSFGVSVDSVNGPNFTSPVTLSAGHLPPGATATFAKNPLRPGESTTMTLTTARPTAGDQFDVDITGVAVTPPPAGPRTVTTHVVIDPNVPNPPEIVSPRVGEVNTPRRPTLAWTAPFVPESGVSGGQTTTAASTKVSASTKRAPFLWELAGTVPPVGTSLAVSPPGAVSSAPIGTTSAAPGGAQAINPFAFGAAAYHLQVARDAAFTSIVIDTQVSSTSFTVPVDLDVATQYFWRVSASNACGTSAFSVTGTFIVGACFETWNQGAAIPLAQGPSQSTVVASPSNNKIYVIGGGLGAGPNTRIDQLWAFDPATSTWQHKTDVPSPGVGANFGAATIVGGTIYVFGGIIGPPGPVTPHRVLWKYNIAADSWSRGADLPTDNFGAAVAALGGQIYLAYGSGFNTQTWAYNPATNAYTRKHDAPGLVTNARVHGVALNGEMHAFAGGFEGNAHVIYNPATDTWRNGPAMPFTATDPAVGVLGGKALVVGGRPTAHAQIFDPATNSWSQGPAILGVATGVDNTAGAVLGPTFHLVGGFDGANGTNVHWQFHACNLGGLSSAALIPFVVDGDGKKTGIGNERTALLLDNTVSSAALSVSCFLYGTTGDLLGSSTFQVAPNETRTVTDVVRVLTSTTVVQNKIGSIALFATDVFQSMASVVNNTSADSMLVDGQPIAGSTSGYLSTAGSTGYLTQTVFANASATTSVVSLLAYPAAGGSAPSTGGVAIIPPRGLVSYTDVVKQLGLASTFTGQLSWTASQPIAVAARDTSKAKPNFSGSNPVHAAGDASSTVLVPYVEDTAAFATALEISNPGSITANVTVHFVETGDATGASSGVERTRDIPVAINSALPIASIVRWARRDASTTPSGRHGFIVVTSPQAVTAQARIVDSANQDPATPDSNASVTSGFSPLLIRVDQTSFAVTPFAQADLDAAAAAAATTSQTRFALSNPGSTTAAVQLTAFNATGSPAGSLTVNLAPDGQFFSENLAQAMGLPPVFLGWVQVQSSAPVLVYNHRRTNGAGATVPVHGQ